MTDTPLNTDQFRRRAELLAEGDSNDQEIDALREMLDIALNEVDALQAGYDS